MEIRDYNGEGEWSKDEIIRRYLQYCHELNVLNPIDLSPIESVGKKVKWIFPGINKVIEGIEQGDIACRRIGIEFIEQDSKFAFGKVLKSNTARVLRRAQLTIEEQERIRHRIVTMLIEGNTPYEFKQYARLLKKIGVGRYWVEIEKRIKPSNPWAMKFYKFIKHPI